MYWPTVKFGIHELLGRIPPGQRRPGHVGHDGVRQWRARELDAAVAALNITALASEVMAFVSLLRSSAVLSQLLVDIRVEIAVVANRSLD